MTKINSYDIVGNPGFSNARFLYNVDFLLEMIDKLDDKTKLKIRENIMSSAGTMNYNFFQSEADRIMEKLSELTESEIIEFREKFEEKYKTLIRKQKLEVLDKISKE